MQRRQTLLLKYQLSSSIQSENIESRGVLGAFFASRNHYHIKRSEDMVLGFC